METIEYKGYKIAITQDDCPINPFIEWDCEPALITYYGGRGSRLKSYQGAPSDLCEILALLPAKTWQRGNRIEFFKQLLADKFSLKEVAEEVRTQGGDFQQAVKELLVAEYGNEPVHWGSAIEWFGLAESLLKFAGIECVNDQSNGHCQGDCTLVLAIALPEWLKKTGVMPENAKQQLESAIKLYSQWAWGDVYGISVINDSQGNELDEGSVWGFYGTDHNKSGLLESAMGTIDWHIGEQAKQASHFVAALCSLK